MEHPSPLLHALPASVRQIPPPPRFTFPFYYVPHPLAVAAAEDLQRHLSGPREWKFDFGLTEGATSGQGKMFGVLVVELKGGELRYLAAYSGKLAESNHLPGFVPPVFDLLEEAGFYKQGEAEINALTQALEALEKSTEYRLAVEELAGIEAEAERALEAERQAIRAAKLQRREERAAFVDPSPDARADLEARLSAESIRKSYGLKDLKKALTNQVNLKKKKLDEYSGVIAKLRDRRSTMSHALQERIFAQYTFLNARGEPEDVGAIFARTILEVPPAGAGECAAPKLLQFAYLHDLRPVALAEFWWGASPASEIRQHLQYYPACRGKCEPILGHMLQGLEVDPNPLLVNPAEGKALTTVYEDEQLLVVNKPAEFLSVPGKHIEDSVWLRIRDRYPEATGPLLVHRLDMSTSGLLLVAKNKETHKVLQRQFFRRTVKKRYVALVSGTVERDEGIIDLPLRGDLEDRPRQRVCKDSGKPSRTHWRIIERRSDGTLLHLEPVTGRTHQLRVHCAHPDGLHAPIVGDDLYGSRADRLYLHAAGLSFQHPYTKEQICLEVPAEF